MDNKTRTKMSMANRAKQFAPFDALKGFREALRSKEKIRIDKKELSEDIIKEINYKLNKITIGEVITIVYFFEGEYLQLTGIVKKINTAEKLLQIGETIISFNDIYSIFE